MYQGEKSDNKTFLFVSSLSHLATPSPPKATLSLSSLHSMSFTFTQSTPFPTFTTTCSFKPNKPRPTTTTTPPTDRVIDFGKYKGKMLGTLPSAYLNWVSKNLRAGDTQHWARLADQVLQDPVYNDRLEWEFADSVLNGNKNNIINGTGSSESAVSMLVEISERFGWDDEDKVGWSRVDFELLGTSRGGRIPRKSRMPRMPLPSSSPRSISGGMRELGGVEKEKRGDECRVLSESEKRRRERRERLRLKKDKGSGGGDSRGSFVNLFGGEQGDQDRTVKIYNPFPGREYLLKKVFNRRGG